jgi:hypothetical protein
VTGAPEQVPAMIAGSFEVPIDSEDALAAAGQHPGDVGERHRASGPPLVRIESNDLAATVDAARTRHRLGLSRWESDVVVMPSAAALSESATSSAFFEAAALFGSETSCFISRDRTCSIRVRVFRSRSSREKIERHSWKGGGLSIFCRHTLVLR